MANTTRCRKVHDWRNLRGLIKTKIGTEGEYAKLIGRSKGFVSAVFSNKAMFDVTDIEASIELCDIHPERIGDYFFIYQVPKSEQEA